VSITGIELGPDYCVLLRARQRGSAIEIGALRIIEPDDWPGDPAAQAALLDEARRELGLPRRTTVVAWDRATFGTRSLDAMLREAGFAVESVISPADALALLAWSRSTHRAAHPGATAWLSINRHGAAMAVVDGLEVLHAHEFAWRIRASEQRVQANILRRYLYVAQLVPEIRRAATIVRDSAGRTIDLAVTCGNIPDLRSFTMPLIHELDIEFETLDSLDGLHIAEDRAAEIAQYAPALRLAGAAAAYGHDGKATIGSIRLLGMAAGIMLVAGAAWWAFSVLPRAVEEAPRDPRPIVAAQGREAPPQPAAPAQSTIREPAAVQERPIQRAQPTTGNSPPSEPVPVATDRPERDAPPLPIVSGILISSDRRLAVINGSVVGPGDKVGTRVIVRIESDAVVFRDPSGADVRVPVRSLRLK
jgi:hypothetical protein